MPQQRRMEPMSCFGITTSSQMGVDLCFVHHAIGISNHEVSLSTFLQHWDCQVSFTKSITDARKVSLSGVHSPRVHSSEIQRTGRKEGGDMRSSRGGQPSRECVFREAERPQLDPLSTLSLWRARKPVLDDTALLLINQHEADYWRDGCRRVHHHLSHLWVYGLWALVVAVDRP